MKKIAIVLFAVIALLAMQSCDTSFNANTDLKDAQAGGDLTKSNSESYVSLPVNYRLVEGSTLYVSYSPDGPIFAVPVNGSFTLNPVPSTDDRSRYFRVGGLTFESKDHNPRYTGKDGNGRYEMSSSVTRIPRQRMAITVSIAGSRLVPLDSGYVPVPADIRFPWIDVTMKITGDPTSVGSIFPYYELRIVAVPMKEIAFTTTASFTPGNSKVRVNHGDLLNSQGRIILTTYDLIKEFKLWPTFVAQEPGLDAVSMPLVLSTDSVRPIVYFSTNKDILADNEPGQGDILTNSGKIIMRNKDLVALFGPMPIAANAGLDALQLYTNNFSTDKPVFLFSFERGFFSETLGVYISSGDLLLSTGKIFMTEGKLLRNYHPIDTSILGIHTDGVALRANNEVWFSVDRDFYDARLGRVGNGDILSNNGRIVLRNRDLVAEFNPLEDINDFGLDGLSIIE